MQLDERQAVIAEARSWIGTPFHDRARVKGAGVDCLQLLIASYHAAGLLPDLRPDYPVRFFLTKFISAASPITPSRSQRRDRPISRSSSSAAVSATRRWSLTGR
jgi:hypothetical protein